MDFSSKVYAKILELLDVFNYDIFIFYFTTVACVLVLESIIVGWKDSSLKKISQFKNSVKTDVFFFITDVLNIHNLIVVILSFGICHVLARLIYEATNFDLILNIDNLYLQFIILFFVSDFKNYFSHYLFHRYNTLWTLHEFHHSATEFCMLTRYRGHFLETALKRFVDVIPFAIFGASIETYILVKILSEVHQLFIHSSVNSDWGFIGKYFIVSPAAHKIHHSIKREHYGKNFGSTFIIWDRMFGTYHPFEKVEELGVPANPYNKEGVIKDVYIGILRFFNSLKADVASIRKKNAES